MFKRLLDKVASARFILTIICGLVFAYCSITKKLDSATITAIIMLVFNAYFERKDRDVLPRQDQDKPKT